jgi:type I site-specific restriction endonuclease
MNEPDTCRRFVVPKLQASGWENDPYSIAEQRYFTEGRIVVRGNTAVRKRGNPIYTYSLRQRIDDGFLASYRVHRIVTQWDAAGWRPSKEGLDRYGREIPDELYNTADFERRVALRARTQAVARHLTNFLKNTDRFAKTIVFCVDQDSAVPINSATQSTNSNPFCMRLNWEPRSNIRVECIQTRKVSSTCGTTILRS